VGGGDASGRHRCVCRTRAANGAAKAATEKPDLRLHAHKRRCVEELLRLPRRHELKHQQRREELEQQLRQEAAATNLAAWEAEAAAAKAEDEDILTGMMTGHTRRNGRRSRRRSSSPSSR
jgi:hypothetical protein